MIDSTRDSQAASKSTPEIDVRMSMRFGGWPSCTIRFGSNRSRSVIPEATEPEISQHGEQPLHVRRRDPDKEIDVAGEARMTVECHGVTADDEIVNAVGVQQFDELSQVGLQLRQERSGAVRSARGVCRAVSPASGQHKTGHRPYRPPQNCRTSERLVPRRKTLALPCRRGARDS